MRCLVVLATANALQQRYFASTARGCEPYLADELASLGASRLLRVLTSGGGAQNAVWTRMRSAMLGVPTDRAASIDAAYGAALLAARGS